MKGEKINIPGSKPRVLVAPLDWGLGHATRCVPIIFKLLQLNCEVIIAAEGAGKILLQKEFPSLVYIDLKGYRVQYSQNRSWMPVKLLLQFPKLIYRIYAESQWLKHVVNEYKIDFVISDNRPGLSHKDIPCVYITHQLLIKTGNGFTEKIAQKIHYHYINKYKACWVPDADGQTNLAGNLSHPGIFPKVPIKYLGPLSRFEKKETAFKYDLCILLSGPEPQRTIFEKMLLAELENYNGRGILVKGLPGESNTNPALPENVEIHNHLSAANLNEVLLQSELIICRSGYTTVMDLIKLQKKAILIPTPGQTEQEYLASHLQQKKLFFCASQEIFSLEDVLKKSGNFIFEHINFPQNNFEAVVENFILNS